MPFLGLRICELRNYDGFSEVRINIDGIYVNLDHEYIFDSRERRTIFLRVETRVTPLSPVVRRLLVLPFETVYPLVYGAPAGVKLWMAADPEAVIEPQFIDAGGVDGHFFGSVDRARDAGWHPKILVQVGEVCLCACGMASEDLGAGGEGLFVRMRDGIRRFWCRWGVFVVAIRCSS